MSNCHVRTATLALLAMLALLWVAGGQTSAQTDSAIEISSCTNITASGTYVLTENISTDTDETCISVQSSDVVLDGQGHEIEGDGYPESSAIKITTNNVTVRNVVVTNFNQGVYFSRAADGRVANVTVRLNDIGIGYRTGSNGEIIDSTAYSNGGFGIYSFGTEKLAIRNNTANDNGGDGIWINSGGTVIDNVAQGNENDDIIVRNIDRSDTTTVRNNSVGTFTMFIARTGTIANNDAEFLRVSEAWNVTVRDNTVSDTLDVRKVNDSLFTDNTVGSNLQMTGGFRSMSGTDQRTTCMGGLVIQDTEITATPDHGESIHFRDNSSGAMLRDVAVGSATLWLSASQNVSVASADSPGSNPHATTMGTYLRLNTRQEAGKTMVAVTYDENALGDGEEPLLYRYNSDGWTALDSYATDGRVGTTITLTNETVVGVFAADGSTVNEHRVERPTSVDIQCGKQNVTIVQQNRTITRAVTETREGNQSDNGGNLPVSVPVLAGGSVAAVLFVGLLVGGLYRRSSNGGGDSDNGDSGRTADEGPATSTDGPNTTSAIEATGEAVEIEDTTSGTAADEGTTAGEGATAGAWTATAGDGSPPMLVVESEAFEPLTAHVRIRDEETEMFRESFTLAGGERRDATELPSVESFYVEAVVDDGPVDRTHFKSDRSGDIRVRLDGDHLEITLWEA